MTSFDPFASRNTWFVARVRNITSKPADAQSRIMSPKKRKLFSDSASYACIPNPKNNSIYISESTYSGKLLNSQCLTKESLNNKFLFPDSAEKYAFDQAYTESCEQKDFYNETTRPLINHVLSGVNALVLTYGPHRSGKSYTMRGDENSEIGLIPRFARDLINCVEATNFGVYISVIQIYKDWVFDLLRADQDTGYSLTNDYETAGISKIKIQDLKDFIRVLGEAFHKRELNSNAANIHLKKFHLVIRISLIDEKNVNRSSFSKVDFVELPESSFLINQKNFQPGELEWLNSSFDGLFDLLVKYHSKEMKGVNIPKNALNNFLEMNVKSKGKLLFICCLSPTLKEIKKSRDALQYVSNLRNLILQKGEKSLIKIGKSIQKERARSSTIRQPPKSPDPRSQSPEASVDHKLKSIKTKLSNASIALETAEDFEDWIQGREYEILKLEHEINILPANSESLALKLKELAQLKNEIKLIKDKKRRTKTSTSVSYDAHSKLNRSDIPARNNVSDIFIIEEKPTTSSRTPRRRKNRNANKINRSSSGIVKSGSKSPSASPLGGDHESSFEVPKNKLSTQTKEFSLGKNSSSKPTPKFMMKTKSVLRKGRKTEGSDTDSQRSDKEKSPLDLRLSKSFTGILKAESRLSGSERFITHYSPRPEDQNPKMLVSERSFDISKRPQFLLDTKSKSELISPKKSGEGSMRIRSRRRVDLENLAKLLEKSQELKSLKDRNFAFLDEEEEYFVRKKLNECSLDKLVGKYRTLFYKSREIKDLLNEVCDNNYKLKTATQALKEDKDDLEHERNDIKQERDGLLDENQKLREELDLLSRNLFQQEREVKNTLREYEQKLLNTEQQKDHLSHKINELMTQNELLSSRAEIRNSNVGALTSNRRHSRSQRNLTEPGDGFMEDRIQELEKELLQKEKKIKDLEETVLKNNYTINELKADLELSTKKLKMSETEIKELQREQFEAAAKNDANLDIISSQKDQIHELQLQLKIKAEQIDSDKQKIRELKDKIKDMEMKNINLKNESEKVGMEAKVKERLEQRLAVIKDELKLVKNTNDKMHEETIDLSKLNKGLEEEIRRKDAIIEDLRKRMNKLSDSEKRIDKYVEKNERLKNIRDELREDNQKLRLEVKRSDQRVGEVESAFAEIRAENQMLRKEKDELERMVAELKGEGDKTRRELDKVGGAVNELSAKLKESEKFKLNYKNQIMLLKQEHTQLKEQYKEKEERLKNEMIKEIEKLNKENEKYVNNQNKLKVITDIQSIIKSHKRNKDYQ